MRLPRHVWLFGYVLFLVPILTRCGKKNNPPVQSFFEVRESSETGLDFVNKLTPTPAFNMFNYMYFYNGSGVGAGDFNNDGLVDLFFAANQGRNKLYLNKGHLQFKDITEAAHIPQDGGWSTGVSVVDINNDGLLDVYICKVGNYELLKSKNQLLVCEGIDKAGIPFYADKAQEYGVDFSGFSTQAAFLDYDMDGDLDLFLLNHSVHQNGSFGPRSKFLGTYHPLSGDRLYRNDGAHFADVTKESGIHSSAISYGLGVAIADIDLDGYPDVYTGNDFHENDYLYINQHNGTFKDDLANRIMHTSKFTMGVDVADINNDAYPEIISADMLPADPYILKRSLGDNEYDIFNLKVSYGYNYQYTRNNLQLNRRNGLFSEAGLYAGVAATDWSWAPLWMDFDNDGLKDLFISNGIPKRLNDMDYINYISNEEVQEKLRNNKLEEKDMLLINKFPQIKLPNKFFRNNGDVSFTDWEGEITNDKPTYSNGAVYADFDKDGDLDIVVNNIDDAALLYENKNNNGGLKKFVEVRLKGPSKNSNAVGSKVVVHAGTEIRTYEKYPVHGFQSSMEVPLHIGLNGTRVDSMFLIWPDNTYQPVSWNDSTITVHYQLGLPKYDYTKLSGYNVKTAKPMLDITQRSGLLYRHEENSFIDFDREPLMPFMVSKEGPGLAVGDANGDGRDDVFVGSAKEKKSAVFFQNSNGYFQKSMQPDIEADSIYEDVDACWVDANGDKRPDLVVASGGNEFYGTDKHMMPRVYLNDGHGVLKKLDGAFSNVYTTASCVVPYDFTGDGAVDLFVGGRAIPWAYGQTPQSYLLQNDGTGKFSNVTSKFANELSKVGFVKSAVWVDVDTDGDTDLVLALEWDGICAFINEHGHFKKLYLTKAKGFWNFTLPCDVDNDGDLDFIAGNLGLNSRLKASEKRPVRLYFNDFDGNGKKEQVVTYYVADREIPFAGKDELQKQLPLLKKQFTYAADFAKATLPNIFSDEKLDDAVILSADYFANAVLINNGNLNFSIQPLPWPAQLAPYKDAVVVNANNDNLPDILLMGNFYENDIQLGRYDADFGTLLLNTGKGTFACTTINGPAVKGQVRHIRTLHIGNDEAFVLARNNDSTTVLQFADSSNRR